MHSLPLGTFWLLVHYASFSIFRARVPTGAWAWCLYPRIVRKVHDCSSDQIQWLTSSWVVLFAPFPDWPNVANHRRFFLILHLTRCCSRLTRESSRGTSPLHSFNNGHWLIFLVITASVLSLLWSLCVIILLVFSSPSDSPAPSLSLLILFPCQRSSLRMIPTSMLRFISALAVVSSASRLGDISSHSQRIWSFVQQYSVYELSFGNPQCSQKDPNRGFSFQWCVLHDGFRE
jgi:hypothetical protein